MLNEEIVAHFKTLLRDLTLGTEENHDKCQSLQPVFLSDVNIENLNTLGDISVVHIVTSLLWRINVAE
jgi:hypothetical protein